MNLYGHKCHICTHLDGPTHKVEATWPVPDDDCPDCSFCQEASFWGMLIRWAGAERAFSHETRTALAAFRKNEPHPLIDQLRAEMQQFDGQADG